MRYSEMTKVSMASAVGISRQHFDRILKKIRGAGEWPGDESEWEDIQPIIESYLDTASRGAVIRDMSPKTTTKTRRPPKSRNVIGGDTVNQVRDNIKQATKDTSELTREELARRKIIADTEKSKTSILKNQRSILQEYREELKKGVIVLIDTIWDELGNAGLTSAQMEKMRKRIMVQVKKIDEDARQKASKWEM